MKQVSLPSHSTIMSRRNLMILIAVVSGAFFLASTILHHYTGMNIARVLINYGLNWANANYLAGVAVGALEDGGVELLGIEVPILIPIAGILLFFLTLYGAPWLTVY